MLERAQPGAGATWASAGMLAVTSEAFECRPSRDGICTLFQCAVAGFCQRIEASQRPANWLCEARRAALGRGCRSRCPGWNGRRAARPGAAQTPDRVRDARTPGRRASVAGGLWSPARTQRWTIGRSVRRWRSPSRKRAGGCSLNEAVVRIERRDGPRRHRSHALRPLSRRRLRPGGWRLERDAGRKACADRAGERPDDPAHPAARRVATRAGDLGHRHLCRAARPGSGDRRDGGRGGLRHRHHGRSPRQPASRGRAPHARPQALDRQRINGQVCARARPTACRCWGRPRSMAFGWQAVNTATASCSRPPSRKLSRTRFWAAPKSFPPSIRAGSPHELYS